MSPDGGKSNGSSKRIDREHEGKGIMARKEPVISVGRQAAFYLAILGVLAGGVGLFAARNELTAVSGALAGSDTPQPIEGEFLLKPALGSAQEDPPKDHMAFYLTGEVAEQMFRALPTAPENDECAGRQSKFGNGLVCYGPAIDGKPVDPPYSCTFAIDLNAQALALAEDC
jgi:hypothetical protein